MKNLQSINPVVTDAISGAFGGAVLGNAFGEDWITIVFSILGAALLAYNAIGMIKKDQARELHAKSE